RIGEACTKEELDKIHREGQQRYAAKIPPGYSDASKPEPDRYGDLVLWKQLIKHTKCVAKPLIFVTDDRKDDWWLERDGKKVGPRPELIQEMWLETNQHCYLYSAEQF